MYSKSKQTFYHVIDSLIKHRWLLTAELIWMIVCSFWTVSEQEKMYQFYNLSASTIDYVIAQQGALYSGLTILYIFPAKRPAWQEIFRHFWRQDISWKKPAALINFVRLFTLRLWLYFPVNRRFYRLETVKFSLFATDLPPTKQNIVKL